MTLIIEKAENKEGWLNLRRQGIGGSDFAGLLGVSKYASPATIYADKMGLVQDKPESGPMYWGTALEEPIARRYEEETGELVTSIPKWSIVKNSELPEWWIGTPDRLHESSDRGLEIKTSRHDKDWGEPGTDEVPEAYLVQCVSYMALTQRKIWDLAVLIGGQDFRIYTIKWNQDLVDALYRAGERFWNENVMKNNPPEMDGSEASGEMLKKLHPRNTRAELVNPDQSVYSMAINLATARAEFDAVELKKKYWENQIKAALADDPGFDFGQAGKITWKNNKDGKKTDWEKVAQQFMGQPDISETVQSNTTTTPGARVFRVDLDGALL